jgi:hypothetical protein
VTAVARPLHEDTARGKLLCCLSTWQKFCVILRAGAPVFGLCAYHYFLVFRHYCCTYYTRISHLIIFAFTPSNKFHLYNQSLLHVSHNRSRRGTDCEMASLAPGCELSEKSKGGQNKGSSLPSLPLLLLCPFNPPTGQMCNEQGGWRL